MNTIQTITLLVLSFFLASCDSGAKESTCANTNATKVAQKEPEKQEVPAFCAPTNITSFVTYPVEGFEGKKVRINLIDLKTKEARIIGPFESPQELNVHNLKENHMYVVKIEVYDPDTKKWELSRQYSIRG